MKHLLEVTGLTKRCGAFRLQEVSFALPENCITGLIGANGAGKTTTIRTLLGLSPKDSGSIKLFGEELGTGHNRKLKNRIGVVFDEGYFYEDLTMAEMKSVIAPAYTEWNERLFKDYMDRFGLHGKQKIATLSKGMRMKFSLALALSHHAELLVMDEPTSGLDPLIRNEMMGILLEFMRTDGKGVFFSTHITSDLDKNADYLIMMDQGKILFSENKDTLLDSHALVKGGTQELDAETRRLLLSLHETGYGFTGLTNRKDDLLRLQTGLLIEKPTVEDIMLGYLTGGR